MNRVFKTRWSIARQQYVVTDEHHTTKDHRKTLIAATVAAVLGGAHYAVLVKGMKSACEKIWHDGAAVQPYSV